MKPNSLHLRVGDTEPYRFTDERQHADWVRVQQQRGRLVANAQREAPTNSRRSMMAGGNSQIRAAKLIVKSIAENEHRRTDQFERARAFLQRKGWVIYCADVYDGPPDRYIVTGKDNPYTKAQVINLARSKGWDG